MSGGTQVSKRNPSKLQAPSSKHQRSSNFQTPNERVAASGFGAWCFSGALVLGAWDFPLVPSTGDWRQMANPLSCRCVDGGPWRDTGKDLEFVLICRMCRKGRVQARPFCFYRRLFSSRLSVPDFFSCRQAHHELGTVVHFARNRDFAAVSFDHSFHQT